MKREHYTDEELALLRAQLKRSHADAQAAIRDFAQRAYDKTGGPTAELRRVNQAYLDNEKRRRELSDKPLGDPVSKFEDTFRAEAVMEMFPRPLSVGALPTEMVGQLRAAKMDERHVHLNDLMDLESK